MGIILIIIVAILAITGLITFNIKALTPEDKPVEEENSLEESASSSDDDPITIITPTDNDELKMKDQDYRSALSKLHNQKPNDEPPIEKKSNLRKMKDEEYRGTLEDFQQNGD
ncbi:hypothetical protein [Peribacillus simplex]|uniref:Uncharacterized protein n=1 Tax=Peribacillus simplex TaxID=1478 RepID=A0AAW7ITV5_9BACI|nr:hypothetical protein [Peribacillus simplex]MDM5455261.1 hypothetical protein [Peribacillus simplex]